MIYNFNHGIGWASSGVEYAQAYRNRIFKKIGVDAKFIFTDMFPRDNIAHLTRNIGFDDEQIIWLYMYFTNIKTAPTTFSFEQLCSNLELGYKVTIDGNKRNIVYDDTEKKYYVAYMVNEESEYVHRVEVVKNGYLIRKDYYSYCKMYSEYYGPKDGAAHLYLRKYYNEDGSIAYEELIDDDSVLYRLPDALLYSKEELVGYMVKKMQLNSKDMVIIDRMTDIGSAIIRNANDAIIGSVVHADHFSEGNTNEDNILWNNYYEFAFAQHRRIDFYVAATNTQTELIEDQFKKYIGESINVITIPVGSIDELIYTEIPRKKHSLITASRLASEKHIDLLINAVVKVHERYPDVSLDIYGKGGEEKSLNAIIDKNAAHDYIKLCGHQELSDVYKKYEAYISGSTSEGFGLTLLEALGSGLPLIGFDVRYGNQTFIKDGENGFLIPINDKTTNQNKIDLLAEAILKLFENDIETFSSKSYEIAKKYLTKEVEKEWQKLVEEI